MYVIVYSVKHGGWCVIDTDTNKIVSASHAAHEDAVAAAQSIAHRVKQGWTP